MGKGGSTDCCKGRDYASPWYVLREAEMDIFKIYWFFERVSQALAERARLCRQDAMHKGPREKLAYIPAVQPKEDIPDYLMTVDFDPESDTYSQVRY